MNANDIVARFPALDIGDYTREYLDKTLVEIEQRGLLDKFMTDLDRLVLQEEKVTLFTDFAPWSFTFQWYGKDKLTGEFKPWIFGGFIFYNAGDSGVGAPQFSVQLGGARETGWYVHT